ncbi:MAG: hypothetical protein IPM06_20950 [Rhizobiales bacterium]|nr:hypothetical protein [Hyphomicrobiales bacterium]
MAKPPTPVAPPPPVPVRDAKIDALRSRQRGAMLGAEGGYQSTMLTGAGGDTTAAATASPTLGK